jgi:hypothetical protein
MVSSSISSSPFLINVGAGESIISLSNLLSIDVFLGINTFDKQSLLIFSISWPPTYI